MREKTSYKPIDLSQLKTYSIKDRKNLVSVKQFATLSPPLDGFGEFINSLPKVLAATSFNKVVEAIVRAHQKDRPVVIALGGHVVKCGLSPIIIDLMERGIITALAMNSSTAIHDYEISLIGETSEDVSCSINDGSFGMVKETAEAFRIASVSGVRENIGLGRALGDKILHDKNKFKRFSLLASGAKLNIPTTVHVAIGADTIDMHPNTSGKDRGESSLIDFKILTSVVTNLEGGVWINIGSAVIMPEVFLKAITIARNLGHKVENLVTVNMDMIQHYRTQTNVVKRPSASGGFGYAITGHHELMLPLLRMAILSAMKV
ncbi:MAG: hypothetical protein ACUZ77_11670 [Candidatus Brocadiales bacterium]